MFNPDTVSMWLKEQVRPIGIVVAIVVVFFIMLKISAIWRRTILSRKRRGLNEWTFVEHLAQYNFDPVIAGTTYLYLQKAQHIQFPILPSDDLDEDLGLDCNELDQTVRELLAALNREETPGILDGPIMTVEDLLRYLQASPRRRQRKVA